MTVERFTSLVTRLVDENFQLRDLAERQAALLAEHEAAKAADKPEQKKKVTRKK